MSKHQRLYPENRNILALQQVRAKLVDVTIQIDASVAYLEELKNIKRKRRKK